MHLLGGIQVQVASQNSLVEEVEVAGVTGMPDPAR